MSLLRRAVSMSGVPGNVRPCPPDHAPRGMTFRDKQDRGWLAHAPGGSLGRRRGGWLAPLDLTEEAEELVVRRQHHAGVVVSEGFALGLHGPIEGVELGVAAVGLARDSVDRGVALTAQDLGLTLRLREDHHALAVCAGADALGLLGALRPELFGLALAFRLHALIDGLAGLLRQIGAADAHVDHVGAEAGGLTVRLVPDLGHELRALAGEHGDRLDRAEHLPRAAVEDRAELRRRHCLIADGLEEAQGIDACLSALRIHPLGVDCVRRMASESILHVVCVCINRIGTDR